VSIQRVAVAGTGMMGPGIAAIFALAGREAVLVSRTLEGARRGVASAGETIAVLVQNGLADRDAGEAARGRLKASADLEQAVRSADLFVESIPEDLELKQQYFERLDRASEKTILCSNTSGLSITKIAARCSRPERVLTTHFWNPPHLMPLVEVVMGEASELAVAERVVSALRECGKTAVLVRKDRPGQLANRIQQAMVRECMHIVAEGIATPEDVDTAIKAGVGLRTPVYGQFEHSDLVGLDLVQTVQDTVCPDLSSEPGAARIHRERVAGGDLGARTGRGMLEWPPGRADQVRARRDAFLIAFLKMKREGKLD
jgi:3-hydroxybutyryl-CoA dehydrogenase